MKLENTSKSVKRDDLAKWKWPLLQCVSVLRSVVGLGKGLGTCIRRGRHRHLQENTKSLAFLPLWAARLPEQDLCI